MSRTTAGDGPTDSPLPAPSSSPGAPGGPAIDDLWAAPVARGPLAATVTLPGSKSLTNRYLVLAALAGEESRLRRPLRSRDTLLMVQALRELGADIVDLEDDWIVTPAEQVRGDVRIDCGLAGTVMRFLPPVAALATGEVVFDGDEQARARPMGPVLEALRELGADVRDEGRGTLPLTVVGTGAMPGGEVTVDASSSSQFVSALLLSGARYADGVTLVHDGKPVPSEPHIEMTVETLRDAGVVVDDSEPHRWRVEPGEIRGLDVAVEPDLSNAGPFLAAALVAGGSVHVPGWPQHTTQAGDAMRDILDAMGADVALDRRGLTVSAAAGSTSDEPGARRRRSQRRGPEIVGIDIDLHDASELTPTVAALAALADSPSWIRGVAHIRFHETDRLAALRAELNALGGDVEETDDGLRITPAPLHGGVFHSYADHRMATAGAILGLAVPGILVQDIATTTKTMPDFPGLWAHLLDQLA